jgi:hypothetical protein
MLVTTNVVPSFLFVVTMMMEGIHSPETLILAKATRRNIPEDCFLYDRRRENFISYMALTGWAL